MSARSNILEQRELRAEGLETREMFRLMATEATNPLEPRTLKSIVYSLSDGSQRIPFEHVSEHFTSRDEIRPDPEFDGGDSAESDGTRTKLYSLDALIEELDLPRHVAPEFQGRIFAESPEDELLRKEQQDEE